MPDANPDARPDSGTLLLFREKAFTALDGINRAIDRLLREGGDLVAIYYLEDLIVPVSAIIAHCEKESPDDRDVTGAGGLSVDCIAEDTGWYEDTVSPEVKKNIATIAREVVYQRRQLEKLSER
jgi:hypothetical protein